MNFSKDINKHIDMTQVLFINNNNDKKIFFEFLIMYFKQISKYKLKIVEYFNGINYTFWLKLMIKMITFSGPHFIYREVGFVVLGTVVERFGPPTCYYRLILSFASFLTQVWTEFQIFFTFIKMIFCNMDAIWAAFF